MATKIFIDQGHNPVNPNAGAEGNGYREQDLVFEIGRRLALILEANGFDVRLSRPTRETQLGTSVSSSLAARVNNANEWDADYFVSLHTNASVNPQANGAEVLVYSTNSPAYELAKSVLEQLTLSTGVRSRGVVARPGLYVLRRTEMPAILVEMGFITNPGDAELMANSPELFARGIADGIIDYVRRAEDTSTSPVIEAAATPEAQQQTENGENNSNSEAFPNDSQSAKPEQITGEYGSIDDFMAENNRRGILKIQAFRGEQALPVEGVSVRITKPIGDYEYVFFEGETNSSGIIDGIELPAPPKENSIQYDMPYATAEYLLTAEKDRFDDIVRHIEIFSDIKTIQPLQMTQRRGIYGTAGNS